MLRLGLTSRHFSKAYATFYCPVLYRKNSDVAAKRVKFTEGSLDFTNHKEAFQHKKTSEIFRALFILKLCSYDVFVNNSLKMMVVSRKLLGAKLFEALIKPTFYDQFVAGNDMPSMTKTIEELKKANLRPMIACMLEEDEDNMSVEKREQQYDSNCQRILECVNLLSAFSETKPTLQVKITGLIPVQIAVKLAQLSNDFSKQLSVVEELADSMVKGSMPDTKKNLQLLNNEEIQSLSYGLQRLHKIAMAGVSCNVKILVDAEYTHMRKGLNSLVLALMAVHNQEKPYVWDTIQCYLKSAINNISSEIELANKLGVAYGVKIVRGAYLETERLMALQQNYLDPVNNSYEDTGVMYNKVVELMLQHIQKVGPKCNIVIATHNQNAIQNALKRIEDLKLNNREEINFAQLYGMSDQVSYPLASTNLAVYKSIPYGSIEEVLPYLYRRATENRSVLKGARQEKELLWKEFKCRIWK